MGRRFNQLAMSWPVVLLSLLGFCFYGAVSLWPASYWLEVRSIKVSDGPMPPVMAVDREIKRAFYGRWLATIMHWEPAGWVAACTARGEQLYNPDAKLPAKLDLDWWTTGQCRGLPAGRYIMRTHWVIDGRGVMPDKYVTADSNIWSVSNE